MDSSLALHPCFQRRRGNHGAEKAKILAAAEKEGLTGAQVSKRFGIAMLTFYKWGAGAK